MIPRDNTRNTMLHADQAKESIKEYEEEFGEKPHQRLIWRILSYCDFLGTFLAIDFKGQITIKVDNMMRCV
jgi:hypothetical protein